jgi:hypothetical protein
MDSVLKGKGFSTSDGNSLCTSGRNCLSTRNRQSKILGRNQVGITFCEEQAFRDSSLDWLVFSATGEEKRILSATGPGYLQTTSFTYLYA